MHTAQIHFKGAFAGLDRHRLNPITITSRAGICRRPIPPSVARGLLLRYCPRGHKALTGEPMAPETAKRPERRSPAKGDDWAESWTHSPTGCGRAWVIPWPP